MSTPLLLGSILLTILVISTLSLWLGAKLFRAERSSIGWAVLAAVLFLVLLIAGGAGAVYLGDMFADQSGVVRLGIPIAVLVVLALIDSLLLMLLFGSGFCRAAGIWTIYLVPMVGMVALLMTVGYRHVIEAYKVPTNTMAPSIAGYHRTGTCPHCGKPMIVPAPEPQPGDEKLEGFMVGNGICTNCRKVDTPIGTKRAVSGPERIMVNKTLTPRRWDAVVFRFPRDPALNYVKRLIGLPGEKVFVKDGAVWVNGEKLDPPSELAGLRFTSEKDGQKVQFGTADNPVQLGADEYWMLGDFSERSEDSRIWGPVPGKNLVGVVGLRHWPLSRLQMIR